MHSAPRAPGYFIGVRGLYDLTGAISTSQKRAAPPELGNGGGWGYCYKHGAPTALGIRIRIKIKSRRVVGVTVLEKFCGGTSTEGSARRPATWRCVPPWERTG